MHACMHWMVFLGAHVPACQVGSAGYVFLSMSSICRMQRGNSLLTVLSGQTLSRPATLFGKQSGMIIFPRDFAAVNGTPRYNNNPLFVLLPKFRPYLQISPAIRTYWVRQKGNAALIANEAKGAQHIPPASSTCVSGKRVYTGKKLQGTQMRSPC